MAKKNPVSTIEWRTKDAARLKSFYGGAFRWKFDDVDPGHYTIVDTGNDEVGGGILQIGDEPMPTGITPYVTVADLGESEQQVQALGGQIMMSKHPVEGWGWFSIFRDPDGNVMGMWQDAPKKERKAAKKAHKKAKKKEKKKAKKQ